LAAVGHARVADEPLSPLQALHVSLTALHTGVLVVQAVAFWAVHCTHVAFTSHAGVGAVQFASLAHCSHLPASAPPVAHTIERHTVGPFDPMHGPSPLA
jgi:hypothetical protein